MSNNETKTPTSKKNSSKNTVETTKVSRKTKRYNVRNSDKFELNDVKRIEKFKNKNHGYRNPPKNTFFSGDTTGSFIVIPVKRKKCSWLFGNPLNSVSTEIIFRFFKKNINILNHNNNLRIMYENYCDIFKKKYGESKISYKDLALKHTIEELIIDSIRGKKHTIASYFKFSRTQRKEIMKTNCLSDFNFYRYIGNLVRYIDYMFYEMEFVEGTKVHKELFFAINLGTLTSLTSDPTKKWITRIDLFDDIRVVKQMPTDYFPYNSRVGIIDLTSKTPHMKTITLSKSTQILEIMKCKKEIPEGHHNDDFDFNKHCYAVCLKKLR